MSDEQDDDLPPADQPGAPTHFTGAPTSFKDFGAVASPASSFKDMIGGYPGVRSAADIVAEARAAQIDRLRDSLASRAGLGIDFAKISGATDIAKLVDTRNAGIRALSDQLSARVRDLVAPPALAGPVGQWNSTLMRAGVNSPNFGLGALGWASVVAKSIADNISAMHDRVSFIDSALNNSPWGGHLASGLHSMFDAGNALRGHASFIEKMLGDYRRSTPRINHIADAAQHALGTQEWMKSGPITAVDSWLSHIQQSLADTMTQWSMPSPSDWIAEAMRAPYEAITARMRSWSTLAGAGSWAARIALRMALAAKRAVERGDLDTVKQFMREWLGFRKIPMDLITSASMVLLDVGLWLPNGLPELGDYDPCPTLRSLTLAEHRRAKRLITDPQPPLNGKTVVSLNAPVKMQESTKTLLQLVAAKPQVEPDAGIDDPRLRTVFDKLSDEERQIFLARGHERNWRDAAVVCGKCAAAGERLRRKVKRLGSLASVQAAGTEDHEDGEQIRSVKAPQLQAPPRAEHDSTALSSRTSGAGHDLYQQPRALH